MSPKRLVGSKEGRGAGRGAELWVLTAACSVCVHPSAPPFCPWWLLLVSLLVSLMSSPVSLLVPGCFSLCHSLCRPPQMSLPDPQSPG